MSNIEKFVLTNQGISFSDTDALQDVLLRLSITQSIMIRVMIETINAWEISPLNLH